MAFEAEELLGTNKKNASQATDKIVGQTEDKFDIEERCIINEAEKENRCEDYDDSWAEFKHDGVETLTYSTYPNLVHAKDHSKKVKFHGSFSNGLYDLDGMRYKSNLQYVEPQCECMKDILGKIKSPTNFAQEMTFDVCTLQKCLPKYFKKNIHRSKNNARRRMFKILSRASMRTESVPILKRGTLSQQEKDYIFSYDNFYAQLAREKFGEPDTTQKDFEKDPIARNINIFDCFFDEIEQVVKELNMDHDEFIRKYFI